MQIRADHYDREHGNKHFIAGIESVMEYVECLPSAEPKTPSNGSITSINPENTHDRTMGDLISRADAIDALDTIGYDFSESGLSEPELEEVCEAVGNVRHDMISRIKNLSSAEPERLTDDDFETIRIHLNAQKEKLCNQQRWEEAEEYQRIIDRFIAFASAEPEIIRCKDCKHFHYDKPYVVYDIPVLGHEVCDKWGDGCKTSENGFCFMAERRGDSDV